jgi:protein O-mannosyl-transferase
LTGRYDEAIAEYQKALELNPQYHTIYNNLGKALQASGRPDEAIASFDKGLEYYPESAELHNHRGLALASKGRVDEAAEQFGKAIEIKPEYADAHRNLGRLLAMSGELDQAVPQFEKAIALNPNFAEAYSELGRLFAVEGQYEKAEPLLEKALTLKPTLVEAHYYFGALLYYSQGRAQQALAQWREALRLEPNYLPAMNDAAHALAASPNASDRNGNEAATLAERAVRLTGGHNPAYLDTLAAAYAEAGRFAEAIDTARKAVEVAEQLHAQQLTDGINARIKLYEAHKPYRDEMDDGK